MPLNTTAQQAQMLYSVMTAHHDRLEQAYLALLDGDHGKRTLCGWLAESRDLCDKLSRVPGALGQRPRKSNDTKLVDGATGEVFDPYSADKLRRNDDGSFTLTKADYPGQTVYREEAQGFAGVWVPKGDTASAAMIADARADQRIKGPAMAAQAASVAEAHQEIIDAVTRMSAENVQELLKRGDEPPDSALTEPGGEAK